MFALTERDTGGLRTITLAYPPGRVTRVILFVFYISLIPCGKFGPPLVFERLGDGYFRRGYVHRMLPYGTGVSYYSVHLYSIFNLKWMRLTSQ